MNSNEVNQALACLDRMRVEALEVSKRYEGCSTPEDGAKFSQAFEAYIDVKNAIREVKDASKILRELQKEG